MSESSPDAKLQATYENPIDSLYEMEPTRQEPFERMVDAVKEWRTLLNHSDDKTAAGVLLRLNNLLFALKLLMDENERLREEAKDG